MPKKRLLLLCFSSKLPLVQSVVLQNSSIEASMAFFFFLSIFSGIICSGRVHVLFALRYPPAHPNQIICKIHDASFAPPPPLLELTAPIFKYIFFFITSCLFTINIFFIFYFLCIPLPLPPPPNPQYFNSLPSLNPPAAALKKKKNHPGPAHQITNPPHV